MRSGASWTQAKDRRAEWSSTTYLPGPAEVEIAFLDHAGEVIRTFSSAGSDGSNDHAAGPAVTARPGLNRFVWDMLYPAALSVPGDLATAGKPTSPHAPPGQYAVRLSVNGTELTQEFEIAKDPRVAATQADLQEKFDLHAAHPRPAVGSQRSHHRTAEREAASGRVGKPL